MRQKWPPSLSLTCEGSPGSSQLNVLCYIPVIFGSLLSDLVKSSADIMVIQSELTSPSLILLCSQYFSAPCSCPLFIIAAKVASEFFFICFIVLFSFSWDRYNRWLIHGLRANSRSHIAICVNLRKRPNTRNKMNVAAII